MRVLVAEDEPVPGALIEGVLCKAAHTVMVVRNGVDALAKLKAEPFDVLITDWMMPEMDGIELIRKVRAEIRPSPIVVMVTAIGSKRGEMHALSSGADGFLAKPTGASDLLTLLRQIEAKRAQPLKPAASTVQIRVTGSAEPLPPFVAVAIAASTGGPDALRTLFRSVTMVPDVAYFVVVHGPGWMQHTCAEMLQKENPRLCFGVASPGQIAQPGHVYLAAGDRHLVVEPRSFALTLSDASPVNFVRPAADPLFESVARAFDRYCIGAVLTGLGSDGAEGAAAIARAGGRVMVQDPAAAVAPPMPTATLRAVKHAPSIPLDKLGGALVRDASGLSEMLRKTRGAAASCANTRSSPIGQ